MWLASVALRDRAGEIVGTKDWTPDRAGEIVGTKDWTPEMWDYARMTLRSTVLAGVGDRSRERMFRMCITACLHRGVTERELRLLPAWWHEAPSTDLAGGPIEVLYTTGLPDIPSAEPCANPRRHLIDPRRPDLYLPLDCGTCPSCLARKAVEKGEQ